MPKGEKYTRSSSHGRSHSPKSKSEEKRGKYRNPVEEPRHYVRKSKANGTRKLNPFAAFVKKTMRKGMTMKEVASLYKSHKK